MTSNTETKKLYIVLSQTGTVLSRLLKIFTHKEFNHSSISPFEDLHLLYSFGRLNAYNPFRGGFTTEGASFGTFKRFSETQVQVIELEVTREQYQNVCDTIDFMLNSDITYRYNIMGLLYAAFGKTYNSKNNYYCSEFVAMLLRKAEIPCAQSLGAIVHPVDFANMPEVKTVYRGKLREFSPDSSKVPQTA
ncbi:MAG: hypothetical protein Q4D44_07035 [Eubacteriales bacterium]|nr:hypothetical protein [Eubacteriales bacterium]